MGFPYRASALPGPKSLADASGWYRAFGLFKLVLMRRSTDLSKFIWQLRAVVLAAGLGIAMWPLLSSAQEPGAAPGAAPQQPTEPPVAAQEPLPLAEQQMPSLWDLAVQGGLFMIPIGVASVVVLAFAMERTIGLRSSRIIPVSLMNELQELDSDGSGIDPRVAYKVCQEHPSPLASIIRGAVLKIGRPHSEVEKAVEDAVARESSGMMRNMRPINVVASIAPLLGLIGTVQGMIMAFMVTSTTSSTGTAKAQELAQGIYTALVTTFAGLCVAVVAVLIANWLESRIERLLRDMEEIFLEIIPQFERYEGKVRVTRAATQETGDASGVLMKGRGGQAPAKAAAKPAAAKPAAAKAAAAKHTAAKRPAKKQAAPPKAAAPPKPAPSNLAIDDDDDSSTSHPLIDDSVEGEDEFFAEAGVEEEQVPS